MSPNVVLWGVVLWACCLSSTHGASLTFVIDTTGSMGNDISQVKKSASAILKAASENSQYDNFILVPFNDPRIGPVIRTTSPSHFQSRLNALSVSGGGDCPEMSMYGIRSGLITSDPESMIYVFTDASAKDYKQADLVHQLINEKRSTVVFLLTGKCGSPEDPDYKVYVDIAAVSGGQIFDLHKSDISEVLAYVKDTVQSKKVPVYSADIVKPGSWIYKFHVDSTITQLIISVSGTNIKFTTADPAGNILEEKNFTTLVNLENAKIIKVGNPTPGKWQMVVSASGAQTIRVTAVSIIDFEYSFCKSHSCSSGNVVPTEGKPVYLLFNVSNAAKVDYVGLSTNGRQQIIYNRLQKVSPQVYGVDISRSPADCFYIKVRGRDDENWRFQRYSTSTICPNKNNETNEKYNCDTNNPCTSLTKDDIENHRFYYAYDGDPAKFVQCSEWKKCFIMPCAPGTIWNQPYLTCVHSGNPPPPVQTTKPPPVIQTTTMTTVTETLETTASNIDGEYNCDSNNPCTSLTNDDFEKHRFYYAYDADSTKFIQCSMWKECFIMPCAPGTRWSQQFVTCVHATNPNAIQTTTATEAATAASSNEYNCGKNNPCTSLTQDDFDNHRFYYALEGDPTKFIQCSESKQCFIMPCAPGTIWSQQYMTCVHGTNPDSDQTTAVAVTPPTTSSSGGGDCDSDNPCASLTDEDIKNHRFYYSYDKDLTKFIQCSESRQCFIRPCAPGTRWNQQYLTCAGNPPSTVPHTVPSTTVTTTAPKGYNCDTNNPCTSLTKDDFDNHRFYYPYDADPTKFVQCSMWKQCFIMPCAPGTIWSQEYQTCVHSGKPVPTQATTVASFPATTASNSSGKGCDCDIYNPCTSLTEEDIKLHRFYYQCPDDPFKFIQCSMSQQCFVMPCAPGTRWSQKLMTCVHDGTPTPVKTTTEKLTETTTTPSTAAPTTTTTASITTASGCNGGGPGEITSGKYNCDDNNPCTSLTDMDIKYHRFYYTYDDDAAKFVQCSASGQCFVMPCSPGTIWSQELLTCDHAPKTDPVQTTVVVPETTTPAVQTTAGDGYNCDTNNICTSLTDEDIKEHRFYYTYDKDPTKFIQCSMYGQCFIMPCGGGTDWRQELQTCA